MVCFFIVISLPLISGNNVVSDPAGSRLPVHLHSSTRAPTLQHIADRMNLICAQNSLSAPLRSVPALMALACEVCHSKNLVLCFRIENLLSLGQVKATYHSCPNSDIDLTCHQFHCTIFKQFFTPICKYPSPSLPA